MLEAPRVGGERVAWANDERNIPSLVASLGNFQGYNLNQGDKNTLISTFRNVWTPFVQVHSVRFRARHSRVRQGLTGTARALDWRPRPTANFFDALAVLFAHLVMRCHR